MSEISRLNQDKHFICLTLFPTPSDLVFILKFAILFIMNYFALFLIFFNRALIFFNLITECFGAPFKFCTQGKCLNSPHPNPLPKNFEELLFISASEI